MKRPTHLLPVVAILLLAACQREASTATQETALPAPAARPSADLVDELARDPERLKAVRQQCRENRPDRDEELCVASAMAARRQFMGEGKAKYTPEPVDLPADTLPPQE